MDDMIKKITKLEHCKEGMKKDGGAQPRGDAGNLQILNLLVGLVEQPGSEGNVGVATSAQRKLIKQRMSDDTQPRVHDVEIALEGTKKIRAELTEFISQMEEEV